MTVSAGTPTAKLTCGTIPANTKIMVATSPQASAGRSFNGQWRWIQTFTTATARFLDFEAAYAAINGAPILGKRIFAKAVQSWYGFQDRGASFNGIVAA